MAAEDDIERIKNDLALLAQTALHETSRRMALEALLLTVAVDFAAEADDRLYYLDSAGERARALLATNSHAPTLDAAREHLERYLARLESATQRKR